MLNDPAGLADRIPELPELVADEKVRAAVESGDPIAVYHALRKALRRGTLRRHEGVIARLLEDRRLFARPFESAPGLATFNGVGTTVYGETERDPSDGSYIKTLFFVFLFLPIYPIAQYLVLDGGGRSWHFLARVPAGPVVRAWRLGIGALAALGAVGGVAAAGYSASYNDVHVVNAFPVPLVARIGQEVATVPPGSRHTFSLPVGTVTARASTESDEKVEELQIDVDSDLDAIVWNVAGAAPVADATVIYREHPGGEDPPPRIHCGESLVQVEDVDYLFEDPPETISLREGTGQASRTHLDVFGGSVEDCAYYAADNGHVEAGAAVLRTLARLVGYPEELLNRAVALAVAAGGAEAGLAIAQDALAAHPDDLAAHRTYQSLAISQGRDAELVEEYRARLDAHPGSADAVYLYWRLHPEGEDLDALAAAAAAHPDHVRLVGLYAGRLYRARRFTDALEIYATLPERFPDDARDYLDEIVQSYLGAGKPDEALAFLRDAFGKAPDGSARKQIAILYARVAPRVDGAVADALFDEAARVDDLDPVSIAWMRSEAFQPVDAAAFEGEGLRDLRETHALRVALQRDPVEALRIMDGVSEGALQRLDPVTWLLLFGECERTDPGGARAERLAGTMGGAYLTQVRGYLVDGTETLRYRMLGLPESAALALARSRVEGLSPDEREALRRRASQDDLYGDVVTRALGTWSLEAPLEAPPGDQ